MYTQLNQWQIYAKKKGKGKSVFFTCICLCTYFQEVLFQIVYYFLIENVCSGTLDKTLDIQLYSKLHSTASLHKYSQTHDLCEFSTQFQKVKSHPMISRLTL